MKKRKISIRIAAVLLALTMAVPATVQAKAPAETVTTPMTALPEKSDVSPNDGDHQQKERDKNF